MVSALRNSRTPFLADTAREGRLVCQRSGLNGKGIVVRLQFLGANRQVTGSRYYLESNGTRILIDCGMFQEREFLQRNWEPSPIEPKKIDVLLLTHAHLDHCGLIPKLVREGFRGKILTTPASADLAELILRDSAQIQAEDLAFKRKRHSKEGRRVGHPEVVLYTTGDVDRAMPRFKSAAYAHPLQLDRLTTATFHDAGHILGSSIVEINVEQYQGQPRRLIFSGDLGQRNMPIVNDPAVFDSADYVVMESTYGDREHPHAEDIRTQMARVIQETVEAGGNVLIPTFAVERAQELMYYISQLVEEHRIPRVPIYLDSPMAIHVTGIFDQYRDYFNAEAQWRFNEKHSPLHFPGLKLVSSVEESMEINDLRQPAIIMASSGMCTAGRIKHHLAHNIHRPESTILFVGFQVRGTLGRQILDGSQEVRIHGRYRPVRARIAQVYGFSGHADRAGLLRWLSHFRQPPRQLFLTHGEEQVSLELADQIRQSMGWEVTVPSYQQTVEL